MWGWKMEKKFYQLDAFTDRPFGGNPAGVILTAEDLTEKQMLNIAREMALSETAFVIKSNESEYDYEVRFFTPTEEVDLCGHATIATFTIMAEKGMINSDNKKAIVRQKTLAGILPVEIFFKNRRVSRIMMTQASPKYFFTVEDINEIANIMGINCRDIGLNGFSAVPMAFSTGLPDIMLPVKSLEVLESINPDFERLSRYSKNHETVGVHAFTIKNLEKGVIACRNFAPAYGINEESATGTSNGALSAYLIKNGIMEIGEKLNLICEQGHFMNRPSEIHVEVTEKNDDIVIKVGGKAVLVMEGKIYL